MNKYFNRLYSDYMMPSRLSDYEALVVFAKQYGYRHMSIRDSFKLFNNNEQLEGVFVHRHDIDSDSKTARKIFEIEKKHRIFSTYYFRLSTLDVNLMREIEDYGSEASYHYEELATYAKKNHIKSPSLLLNDLELVRNEFYKNLNCVRFKTGLECSTVSSHGDFANRKLGLPNHILLNDHKFRLKCGIIHESYDKEFMDLFGSRITDKEYPAFWSPVEPAKVIEAGVSNIFLLTHPRQWKASFIANTLENVTRVVEGVVW